MSDNENDWLDLDDATTDDEPVKRDELGLTVIENLKLRENVQSAIFKDRRTRRHQQGLPLAFGEGELEALYRLVPRAVGEAKRELIEKERVAREEHARQAARTALNLPHKTFELVAIPNNHPVTDDVPLCSSEGSLFSDVVKSYVEEKLQNKIWRGAKTQSENQFTFSLFIEVVGDRHMGAVTYEHARKLKDVLVKIPANYKRRFPGMPVLEVIKQPDIKARDRKSINKNLTSMSGLFGYAKRHGYCEKNPFEELSIPPNQSESLLLREAFTNEEVKLFCTSLEKWLENSVRQPRSYQFWLPLLGMYTGARLNELCQLYLHDITQQQGVWCISITDRDDQAKTLKNVSSIRFVPIHSHLIQLGLLEHVELLRKAGQTRLFPEISKKRDGFGAIPGEWFREYRRMLGIGKEEGYGSKKVFHCYRHMVSDNFRHMGVAEVEVAAIVGHEHENETFGTYSRERLEKLRAFIEKMDYGITPDEILAANTKFDVFRKGQWKLRAIGK